MDVLLSMRAKVDNEVTKELKALLAERISPSISGINCTCLMLMIHIVAAAAAAAATYLLPTYCCCYLSDAVAALLLLLPIRCCHPAAALLNWALLLLMPNSSRPPRAAALPFCPIAASAAPLLGVQLHCIAFLLLIFAL